MGSPGAPERRSFYARTLEQLLARGVLGREMSLLVVAGGEADEAVLSELGFGDVTITNLETAAPAEESTGRYPRAHQDAEDLTYADESFDFAVVSAGLHHCRSPHRALLELYRVARRGALALESRDSLLMRAALVLGLADEYEVAAVAAHGLRAGGVRNSCVPNYVYRWTEREVAKTIASHAPHARHELLFFHELEPPHSILELRSNRLWGRALRALEPLAGLVARVAPGQSNLFAFAVLKPELPGALHPWLVLDRGEPVPDRTWFAERYPAVPR